MAFDRSPIIEKVEEYEPNSVEIVISGHKLTVYEMSLATLEAATGIVEPYLAILVEVFQPEQFIDATGEAMGTEVLMQRIMDVFRSKVLSILTDAPTAVLQAILCVINADPGDEQILDILRNATPNELMGLLEKVGELNDFGRVLSKMTEIIGYLKKRYIPKTE